MTRGFCRVCRRDSALTRAGNVWHHLARVGGFPRPRCPGAGVPPLGRPGPDLEVLPGQRRDTDPLVREHPGGTVYLVCFDSPFSHARHYLGWAGPGNLGGRLSHHLAGTGSNLLAHVGKAGIGWTLVRTWSGDRNLERRLKRLGGHGRVCPSCRPELRARLTEQLAS